MNLMIRLKTTPPLLIALVLACLALSPRARAVVPAPDGGYPGQNTAEGQSALLHLAGGTYNTAVGWASLGSNVTGNYNTAIGAGALLANTGGQNIGNDNTATGAGALLNNTTGNVNTANGTFALSTNTTGSANTATGDSALSNNTTGSFNTATGDVALQSNNTGSDNTAIGDSALRYNTTGSKNTAIGYNAGALVTGAHNRICIGSNNGGNVNNSCYIDNIWNQPGGSQAVYVNSEGKLGAQVSSRRFKDEIKPMDKTSEVLLALKPVTFRYKKEIDPASTSQFGLVAEEVEKVNPDLVIRDTEGKPYTVRDDQVNAMLLNEFLKEHRKVQELEANAAKQQKQIEALTAGLQKVSAQLAAASPSGGGLQASKIALHV